MRQPRMYNNESNNYSKHLYLLLVWGGDGSRLGQRGRIVELRHHLEHVLDLVTEPGGSGGGGQGGGGRWRGRRRVGCRAGRKKGHETSTTDASITRVYGASWVGVQRCHPLLGEGGNPGLSFFHLSCTNQEHPFFVLDPIKARQHQKYWRRE